MNIPARVTQKLALASGTRFWIKKTITSSAIPINSGTPTAITAGSTGGRLAIVQVYLQTDATGLVTGTNFELAVTNSKGLLKFAVETVANLGANVTKALCPGGNPAGDTTTADAGFTVSATPCSLETGKKITIANSVAAGTGAGTVDILICFERIDAGANIIAA